MNFEKYYKKITDWVENNQESKYRMFSIVLGVLVILGVIIYFVGTRFIAPYL